ncbi:MAG: hypothetical protein Kow0099_25180 [Candidatus Abyssubacteria bacterium]
MTRKNRKTNPDSIALCMIVKDEEDSLPRCLQSVTGLVSEVNIIDTGSTDRTIRIAKSHGAKIRKVTWNNDFSHARNASLQMARAAWVLILDADEALDVEAISTIKEAVQNPHVPAYCLPTRNYTYDASAANFVADPDGSEPGHAAPGWVESRKVRLFRRAPDIRFEGTIHELVEPSLKRAGKQAQFLNAVVHHFGYLKDESFVRAKTERMALLAEAKCRSNPHDYKAHYELGVILNNLGRLDRALEALRRAVELSPHFAQARYDLGVAFLRKGLLDEAVSEFRNVMRLDPKNHDAMYNLAVSLQKLRRDHEAEQMYRLLLTRWPSPKAWNNLGTLLATSGRSVEAEEAFKNALALDASFSDARQNLKHLRHRIPARNEERADMTSPKRDGISLCMIVKNEQEQLPLLLDRIAGTVDELVIVDTGSSDNTRAIAERFGARVYEFDWINDFAAARNYCLEKATHEWILVLDADEMVSDPDCAALRKLTRKAGVLAFSFETRNYTRDSSLEGWRPVDCADTMARSHPGWFPSEKVRLFRNMPSIRFEGAIHELVEPSLARMGGVVERAPIPIHHYGYDKVAEKAETYLEPARRKTREQHENPEAHFELGAILHRLRRYDEACQSFRAAARHSPETSRYLVALGESLRAAGRMREAKEAYENALALTPDDRSARRGLGVVLFNQKEFDAARREFELVLEMNPSDVQSLINLGATLAKLEDIVPARQYFERALELNPQHPVALSNLKALSNIKHDCPIEIARRNMNAPGTKSTASLSKSYTLSVCMIAKNEGKRLGDALRAVAPIADEIVVVDTGSTDETIQVARGFGAVVTQTVWTDDFSAARNESLALATSEWILVIDADELLASADLARLASLSPAPTTAGYSMVTRNYSSDRQVVGWQAVDPADPLARAEPGWYPSVKVRLFRNHPAICFEGRVHECVEPSILRAGLRIESLDVPIHHYGCTETTREKAEYYLALTQADARQNPDNPRLQTQLGIQHMVLGNFSRAEDALARAVALAPNDEKALLNLAGVKFQLDKAGEARSLLEHAAALNPHSACLHYNLGMVMEKLGLREQAEQHYRHALALDPKDAGALARLRHLTTTSMQQTSPCCPEDARMKASSPQQPELTLNMIVKDEEQNLKEALAPIAHLFDEIVIVDTGSSDATIEIAEQLGARVVRHAWTDDFSDARNAALSQSTGQWIFWLDADDRITPEAVGILRKFIARGTPCGVFFPLESKLGDNGTRVKNYSLRMFPNRPGLAWTGRVHEQIADSLKYYGLELVNCPDFTIRHVGYEGEGAALRKNLRNLKLLAMEVAVRPEDPYLLFSLAQAFLFCGQTQHAADWLRAVWQLREKRLDESAKDVFWAAAIVLSDCAAKTSDSPQAELWLRRAIELLPQNWLAYFLLGERKLLEGSLEEANQLMHKVAELRISPTILPLDIGAIRQKFDMYQKRLHPVRCPS